MSLLRRALIPLRASARPQHAVGTPRATLGIARQYTSAPGQVTGSDPQATLPAQNALPGKLPYHVGRNSFNNWGIYYKTYNDSQRTVTVLKNIRGDLEALRSDLAEALKLPRDPIKINAKGKSIRIPGELRERLIEFIEGLSRKGVNQAG